MFSIHLTASSSTPVVSGIAASAMISGRLNQRSRTVWLIHGVAIEISSNPPTIGSHAILAHFTARF